MRSVKYPGKSPHGSEQRYRWELANQGGACPVCKAANTQRARDRRDRSRRAGIERAVVAVEVNGTVDPDDLLDIGPLERAVRMDLAGVSGPGTETLRQTALALAREVDSSTSRQAKAPLAKQLTEVMERLIKPTVRTPEEELAVLLKEFEQPLTLDARIDRWSAEVLSVPLDENGSFR
ncbi:hypothetical protein [Cryobacterium glucosi]|uniref:Uncharacterized protein n=1 Tax=Cryobacterium glucosi TaxID=1259175 RepID=A0ABY2IP67_9MICO|nr:hypothetical protein [Cryobacterium glucosi]TFC21332.1 hypothetical protein E3O46_06965 [Cryobacterium glucosi]